VHEKARYEGFLVVNFASMADGGRKDNQRIIGV
jgi:hypothetical protein